MVNFISYLQQRGVRGAVGGPGYQRLFYFFGSIKQMGSEGVGFFFSPRRSVCELSNRKDALACHTCHFVFLFDFKSRTHRK